MGKLDDVSGDELREALHDASDAKATKRLMIALAYRDGEDVADLSERYDIPASTIYYWLDRFENQPIEAAIVDEDRPGRPSKLDDKDRKKLMQHLAAPPEEQGIEATEWTPEATREYIHEAFGVEYSLGHVRRLLREIGTGDER
jgi:transposase